MRSGSIRKIPELVIKGGEPVAVILDIEVYKEMLERLEDIEDIKMLEEMRKKKLHFKKLDIFLEEIKHSA